MRGLFRFEEQPTLPQGEGRPQGPRTPAGRPVARPTVNVRDEPNPTTGTLAQATSRSNGASDHAHDVRRQQGHPIMPTQNTATAGAAILKREIDALFAPPNKRTIRHQEALNVMAKLDGRRNDNVATMAGPDLAQGRPGTSYHDAKALAGHRLSLTRHAIVGWGPADAIDPTTRPGALTARMRDTDGIGLSSDLFERPTNVPEDHVMTIFHMDQERPRQRWTDGCHPNDGSVALLDSADAEHPGLMIRSLLQGAVFGRTLRDGETCPIRNLTLPENFMRGPSGDLPFDTYCYEYDKPNMCVSDYGRMDEFVAAIGLMQSLEATGFRFCMRTFGMAELTFFHSRDDGLWVLLRTEHTSGTVAWERGHGATSRGEQVASATRLLDALRHNLGISTRFDGAGLLAAIHGEQTGFLDYQVAIGT